MIVLAMDTATTQSTVAIGTEDKVYSICIEQGAHHAESLVPAIRELCAQSGWALSDLDAIAVDIGPGLFTGLRVGVATAKSLAHALGIGVVGIISLDALALPVATEPGRNITVVDARRGEVFVRSGGTAPALMDPESLLHLVRGEIAATVENGDGPVRLVGDGAHRYRELFSGLEVQVMDSEYSYPTATSLVTMALPLIHAGAAMSPNDVVPFYLRHADATINWQTRDGAAPGTLATPGAG